MAPTNEVYEWFIGKGINRHARVPRENSTLEPLGPAKTANGINFYYLYYY